MNEVWTRTNQPGGRQSVGMRRQLHSSASPPSFSPSFSPFLVSPLLHLSHPSSFLNHFCLLSSFLHLSFIFSLIFPSFCSCCLSSIPPSIFTSYTPSFIDFIPTSILFFSILFILPSVLPFFPLACLSLAFRPFLLFHSLPSSLHPSLLL